MLNKRRYVPILRNVKIRTAIGFVLLVLSSVSGGAILGKGQFEVIEVIVPADTLAWVVAVFVTDKYVHKYPQRYFTYLIASHLKAAVIMALLLWIMSRVIVPLSPLHDVLWTGYVLFVLADALISVPRRRDIADDQSLAVSRIVSAGDIAEDQSNDPGQANTGLSLMKTQAIPGRIRSDLDKGLTDFIEKNVPNVQGGAGDVLVLDDLTRKDDESKLAPVGLLVGRMRINDVRRLNRFLDFCARRIMMGGWFVIRYVPLENVIKDFKYRHKGLRYWMVFIPHFIWCRAIPKIPWLDIVYFSSPLSWVDALWFSRTKRRNRVLSKAEVWGRLSYFGMRVIAESKGDGEIYLLAQRVRFPVQGKRPSYYPIVALEKVGLGGEIIHAHKIRTMFPFSEFLQKQIFEDHGLASSGKFRNDFRLTEFGRFLRKYWLDELPQIFDWLRGDVKLVGIRATSRHFLSLYPRKFLDLYVRTKPGLIPPIFDDSINGFDQIVDVELTYLQRYYDRPFRTDVRYLSQTFVDIVFKGIRSR